MTQMRLAMFLFGVVVTVAGVVVLSMRESAPKADQAAHSLAAAGGSFGDKLDLAIDRTSNTWWPSGLPRRAGTGGGAGAGQQGATGPAGQQAPRGTCAITLAHPRARTRPFVDVLVAVAALPCFSAQHSPSAAATPLTLIPLLLTHGLAGSEDEFGLPADDDLAPHPALAIHSLSSQVAHHRHRTPVRAWSEMRVRVRCHLGFQFYLVFLNFCKRSHMRARLVCAGPVQPQFGLWLGPFRSGRVRFRRE